MSAPTWNELRADGRVVVDAPARKLAVYANDVGHVVLMARNEDDVTFTEVQADEVDDLIDGLRRAQVEAQAVDAERTAEYAAFVAVEKARGSRNA